jgi:hypothetical protein
LDAVSFYMQKIVVIALILVVASLNESFGQRKRRAERTSAGKAAYGVATVSGKGKVKKVRKARKEKAVRRKTRAAKSKPAYRKKQNWAG